jgi:hypothetical protein
LLVANMGDCEKPLWDNWGVGVDCCTRMAGFAKSVYAVVMNEFGALAD